MQMHEESAWEWNKDFVGLWVNENKKTRGITKCQIAKNDGEFIVQMWGACMPQDCDMGKNKTKGVKKRTNKFELLWDSGFAESSMIYEMIEGKLKLTHKRHFKDNSGRPDYTIIEYFVKK